EEDRRDRPARPLPAGVITLRHAQRLGGALLISGLVVTALVGATQFVIALILVTLIIAYNAGVKKTPFGAPLMGACRLTNWLLALSIVDLTMSVGLLALPIFFYVTSLTLLSQIETTAHTKMAIYACAVGMMITAITLVLLNATDLLPHSWALLLVGAGLTLILQRLYHALNELTPANIQQAVTTLVLGIIPLDAIMVFAGAQWWGGVVVISLWFCARLYARRLAIT
ncbi:MAG: 4-hydroxybenzoate octaprenyltransferase, partial [Halothiobacillaceae bacterium]